MVALIGLIFSSLILVPVIFIVYVNDFKSPFYIAPRVGKDGKIFKMVKLRSMVVDSDKNGISSTSSNDKRITKIGRFIRKYKLDEFTQLWNVLLGDMSLVGPRPNIESEINLYTVVEKKLLEVRPGITDFSSIIFSDEGEILKDCENPNLSYNELIRPWKSRLGLIYIDNQNFWLDIQLIYYTLVNIISKKKAISWIIKQLELKGVDSEIIQVSKREDKLYPHSPP